MSVVSESDPNLNESRFCRSDLCDKDLVNVNWQPVNDTISSIDYNPCLNTGATNLEGDEISSNNSEIDQYNVSTQCDGRPSTNGALSQDANDISLSIADSPGVTAQENDPQPTYTSSNVNGYYPSTRPCPPVLLNQNQQRGTTTYNTFEESLNADNIPDVRKPIKIKVQPRQYYHPRTVNEFSKSCYFLRTNNENYEYPTISIDPSWKHFDTKAYIKVTLLDVNYEPHPYIIEISNDEGNVCTNPIENNNNCENESFVLITNEDFQKQEKSFKIQLKKKLQDEIITKKLIKEKQLDRSILSFKVCYMRNHLLFEDDLTTVHSDCMIEKYSDVAIKDIVPKYGPTFGDNVAMEMKGNFKIDDIRIEVDFGGDNRKHIETLTKSANWIKFRMLPLENSGVHEHIVAVSVYHQAGLIDSKHYTYIPAMDVILPEPYCQSSTAVSSVSSTTESNVVLKSCSKPKAKKRKLAKSD